MGYDICTYWYLSWLYNDRHVEWYVRVSIVYPYINIRKKSIGHRGNVRWKGRSVIDRVFLLTSIWVLNNYPFFCIAAISCKYTDWFVVTWISCNHSISTRYGGHAKKVNNYFKFILVLMIDESSGQFIHLHSRFNDRVVKICGWHTINILWIKIKYSGRPYQLCIWNKTKKKCMSPTDFPKR